MDFVHLLAVLPKSVQSPLWQWLDLTTNRLTQFDIMTLAYREILQGKQTLAILLIFVRLVARTVIPR